MGGMPSWFAKTPEMCASDQYFSVKDAGSEQALVDRYHAALGTLQGGAQHMSDSVALRKQGWDASAITRSMGRHFVGDWIHESYDPANPAQFGSVGGRFWPQVASTTVVEQIRWGTIVAIQKALGQANLLALGMSQADSDDLFEAEHDINKAVAKPLLDLDGVLPLSTTWNCTAPSGESFFDTEVLRGPTVVELAIATPKPATHTWDIVSKITPVVDAYQAGVRRPAAPPT